LIKAPLKVIKPAAIHIIINSSGEPSCSAILEGFLKIPDPIIEPATIIIVAVKDNPRTSSVFFSLLGILFFAKVGAK
jgi:hypothetical protein